MTKNTASEVTSFLHFREKDGTVNLKIYSCKQIWKNYSGKVFNGLVPQEFPFSDPEFEPVLSLDEDDPVKETKVNLRAV